MQHGVKRHNYYGAIVTLFLSLAVAYTSLNLNIGIMEKVN